jgi:hypothetical protein
MGVLLVLLLLVVVVTAELAVNDVMDGSWEDGNDRFHVGIKLGGGNDGT